MKKIDDVKHTCTKYEKQASIQQLLLAYPRFLRSISNYVKSPKYNRRYPIISGLCHALQCELYAMEQLV